MQTAVGGTSVFSMLLERGLYEDDRENSMLLFGGGLPGKSMFQPFVLRYDFPPPPVQTVAPIDKTYHYML